jgi:DNA-binding MarR family transcriptional regulator
LERPEPTVGLLIIAARQAIRQAITARARKFRLTSQQFWALVALRQIPGLTPGELAHWMLLDAPAASRLVADLGKKKLVEVRPDREDRRRTRLYLAEKGEPLAAKLTAIADAYKAACVRGMGDAELQTLRAGLRKVVENLAGFGEDVAPPAGARDRAG